MLETFKSLFFGDAGTTSQTLGDDARLAAAALLVEAALVDGNVDGAEGQRILSLLQERFAMSENDATTLLNRARALQEQSNQIYPFTKVIVEQFDAGRRIETIEMLWEVVYADGQLHDYEASLVRRVAGLLYVSDQESGAARQRATARLGLTGPLA
ncbi:TerB family tellurite resistance protein [Telmatospirillum sp.]|uniref:tellurite resistance TerB family protein n=1 Tax=Telmatospirillum sp. TaxID=2079197 RepID=UPI0028440A42|nr:TerB family tellurite resistance protein [Telmatospirillum sp.]MDR3440246.1 TerB family tellurite resistance protein [Telmatospirillum sp.]